MRLSKDDGEFRLSVDTLKTDLSSQLGAFYGISVIAELEDCGNVYKKKLSFGSHNISDVEDYENALKLCFNAFDILTFCEKVMEMDISFAYVEFEDIL